MALRILYAIMSYEPENIGNEVHEELVAHFTERGHSVEVLTLRAAGAIHRDKVLSNKSEVGSMKSEAARNSQLATRNLVPTDNRQPTTDNPFNKSEVGSIKSEVFTDNRQPTTDNRIYTLLFPSANFFRRVLRAFCNWLFHYNYFLELVFGLRRFFKEKSGQYDVIHIEAAYPLGAAVALARAFNREKVPQVVNLQGADVMNVPRYDYGYGRYRLVRWLLRYTFGQAAAIRPNSYYTAELAYKLGAKQERTEVILRNIGKAVLPPEDLDLAANKREKQAELRARYSLNSGPIIMAYSRLHPFKGVEFLVRAVPIIRDRSGPLNLLVCGPSRATPRYGDYRQYLEKLAQQLGVQEEIIFTGRIDFAQSRDYLAAADLLIVPSVVEALNKVATEAAAVGTPSIITETTGVGRHAAEAGVALLVKPASESALANAIIELLQDPTRRAEMGGRGPKWARQYLTPHVGDQLLSLYQKATKLSNKYQVTSNKSEIERIKSKLSTDHPVLSNNQPPTTNNSLCYVAYPSSLTLKSANSIQTFSTLRELKKIAPETLILLPKLLGRASAFKQVGAKHLLRVPLNFFSNFPILKKIPWGYLERTFFAAEVGFYLLGRKLIGREVKAIYVRDVVCAYWLLKLWRNLLGAKIVYEAHDLEARNPSRARGRWLSIFLQKADQTILSKADGVVSLTEAFRDFLVDDKWREASRSATVIPDAYDANVYKPLPQLECRQKLGIAEHEFALVYAGLTFSYRGLDRMIEAFGDFLKDNPAEAQLYLVGGRPFEVEQLREQAHKAGLAAQVRFIAPAPQEQVNLWLNAASLTIIPDTVTDLTASPLKMFEYAAVARPVLLPDIPALREILGEDEAIYFERGNRQAITAALCRVYTNPAEAAARGEAARRKVLAYTYENRAKAILEFVRILVVSY